MTFQIKGIWLIVFVALFVAALMFFIQKCNDKAPTPIVTQQQLDSANQRNRELLTAKFKDSIFQAGQIRLSEQRVDSVQVLLSNADRRIQSLIKDGNTYRKQLDYYAAITDTGMIDVHPSYITYCDSLADLTVMWERNYNDYRKESISLISELNDQLGIKNQQIESEKAYSAKTSEHNAWLTKGITEIANKNKPRNKAFFGVAVAGTQVNPLYGFGLGVGFMNKKEQLVNADALMIKGGELMFQLSGKFKISFR